LKFINHKEKVMIPKETFKKRREKVFKMMENNSILLLDSASFKEKNNENNYIYRQSSNFFYLTGYKEPSSTLVLFKSLKEEREMLFVEENNPYYEVWTGKKKSDKEVKEETGIENVFYNKDFYFHFGNFVNKGAICYYDFSNERVTEFLGYNHYKILKLREHFPQIKSFLPVNNIIYPLRAVKDKYEIECIKEAIRITKEGIFNCMKNAKEGMFEYQVQADLEYIFLKNGVLVPAFPSIVASGKNGATLHYTSNNQKVKKGDLILVDVGAEYELYSADITRVFPPKRKFTEREKKLYNPLLEVQEKIIDSIKPGISLKELNEKTNQLIGKLLISLKYIKDVKDVKKYYPHSVGHMLGLDTHDISQTPRYMPELKENMVLTIEPGIYIPEEGIGLRIEDDILVTKKGCENLSREIPKSVKGIEKVVGV